jgi:hypothetical protein
MLESRPQFHRRISRLPQKKQRSAFPKSLLKNGDRMILERLPKVISVWMAIASFSEPRSGDIPVAVPIARSAKSTAGGTHKKFPLRVLFTATRMSPLLGSLRLAVRHPNGNDYWQSL